MIRTLPLKLPSLCSWWAGLTLCFCLLVILWGAYVRISHSGDGCGPHWPSCHGEYVIDSSATSKTWIEWTHRATSGLFGLMVLLLCWFCWIFAQSEEHNGFRVSHLAMKGIQTQKPKVVKNWQYPFRHPLLISALWVLFFTLTEALLGARLVLAGLTGSNSSLARALTMNLHLLNSLLLVGGLFICWRISLGRVYEWKVFFRPKVLTLICLFFMLALLGSFSALSSSLFPSSSLLGGLSDDFHLESHYLIRLRLWHPLLALILGGGILLSCFWMKPLKNKPTSFSKKALKKSQSSCFVSFRPFFQQIMSHPPSLLLLGLSLALLSGMFNLILLSPVLLKLTHLLAVYFLEMLFLFFLESREP